MLTFLVSELEKLSWLCLVVPSVDVLLTAAVEQPESMCALMLDEGTSWLQMGHSTVDIVVSRCCNTQIQMRVGGYLCSW